MYRPLLEVGWSTDIDTAVFLTRLRAVSFAAASASAVVLINSVKSVKEELEVMEGLPTIHPTDRFVPVMRVRHLHLFTARARFTRQANVHDPLHRTLSR